MNIDNYRNILEKADSFLYDMCSPIGNSIMVTLVYIIYYYLFLLDVITNISLIFICPIGTVIIINIFSGIISEWIYKYI